MSNLEVKPTQMGSFSEDDVKAFLSRVNCEPVKPTPEQRAAKNLIVAYSQMDQLVKSNHQFFEQDFKNFHLTIMNSFLPLARLGNYCLVPKTILNPPIDSVAPFLDPSEVEKAMQQLVPDFNSYLYSSELKQDPIKAVEAAANFHWRFGQIHPFADGNGRLARLGNDAILTANGLHQIPHWIDEKQEGSTNRRKEYYTAIRDSQLSASDTPLAQFLAKKQIQAIDLELEKFPVSKIDFQGKTYVKQKAGVKRRLEEYLAK